VLHWVASYLVGAGTWQVIVCFGGTLVRSGGPVVSGSAPPRNCSPLDEKPHVGGGKKVHARDSTGSKGHRISPSRGHERSILVLGLVLGAKGLEVSATT
jgi:hypothetical protein